MTAMNDEQAIRDLIANWMRFSAEGDLPRLLTLMDEDVVFLVVGQPPMRGRDAFAAGFQKAVEQFRIDGKSDIQEIKVTGNWAYTWNHLSVTMTPLAGGAPQRRSGNILSIFLKNQDGNWVLFRDANLLVEE
jgi:uncharacterized protein (TIGR02246 family)